MASLISMVTVRAALAAMMALALAACGGADPATGTVTKTGSASGRSSAGGSTVAPDATLTARSLAQAEAEALKADAALPLNDLLPGTIAAKQAYTLGDVARKAAAVAIPVYRFYNTNFVDNMIFGAPSEGRFRAGVISVLAGDVFRHDNPFQEMLLRSRRHATLTAREGDAGAIPVPAS